MKQLTKLRAKTDFKFRATAKSRAVTAVAGSDWWITNTETMQASSGLVMVDRKGRGTLSNGYAFTPEQISDLFHVIE